MFTYEGVESARVDAMARVVGDAFPKIQALQGLNDEDGAVWISPTRGASPWRKVWGRAASVALRWFF